MRRSAFAAAMVVAAACAATMPAPPAPAPASADDGSVVRVGLGRASGTARLSATGEWRLYDATGGLVVRGVGGDSWAVEQAGAGLRAVRADGVPTEVRAGPFVARPVGVGARVSWNARPYRGELAFVATDSGLAAVNRVPLEEYLRGVVPLEIGERTAGEHAAVEAQAVAARSYAVAHLDHSGARAYDLGATVLDQVYGGLSAETAVGDAGVQATAGLVLTYAGRTISAPYHSTCGGSTAEPTEVWQSPESWPYLRRVSDRIPGTDRYYCDASPRFHWTRDFDRASLAAVVDRYLRRYAAVPPGGVGAIRSVSVDGRTPSGRVASLTLDAESGRYTLRGNEIRFVLRTAAGELLNSTYFSVAAGESAGDGALGRLTLRGSGYGHGVGMCQWGAIGRARAGQDFRSILLTYYPGTTVEHLQ